MGFTNFFRKSFSCFNNCLDYNKDDPLILIKVITLRLYEIRYFLLANYLALIYHLIFLVFQIYLTFTEFDVKQTIQFWIISLGALHGYITVTVAIVYEGKARSLTEYQSMHFTELSQVTRNTRKKIMRHVYFRRYLFVLFFISLQSMFIFLCPVFGYDNEFFFGIYFFNEYVEQFFGNFICFILKLFFYASYYIFLGTGGAQVYLMAYWSSHMQYQIIVIEENLEVMKNEFSDCNIRHDDDKQTVINLRLKSVINHYQIIKWCQTNIEEWSFLPIFGSLFGSFVFLLSILLLTASQRSIEVVPRVFSGTSIVLCAMVIYAVCGQGLVNQCESLYQNLYDLPWYNFNEKNKSLLRYFMVYTEKPILFGFLQVLVLDNTLTMKVFKFLYSSIAVIKHMLELRVE